MSLLKERLSRLKKEPSSVAANSIAVEERSADNSAAESSLSPRQSLGAAWDRLGACMQLNDWGQFIVRRLTYPLQYAHGTYRLGELVGEAEPLSRLTVAAKSGKRKAQAPAAESHRVSHSRMLFLDTETTGLGIGAGNVAFMVGIGFYETDAFVVEQMFIRNPSEEAAMLHHLRCRLAERDLLVSYNGKSFDWPIIKNRYILNRQKEHAVDPLHIDFLYPSRSLWRNTLPSCRLSSVERERLGLSRIDDVPGSLAPALYFQYLAEGDPTVVAGVFEHNEKDVLTLACLAVHLSRLAGGLVPTGRMEP
ncbi:MAG: ribonuclease H-like protein, partial [Paenibacillus sp.]|nr:ribonuclease H-like protein [Paenibacillus sp.]